MSHTVRRCGKLNAPENGYMKCSSDGDNYGATCEFSCIGGYELQGSPARVCQSNLAWSGTEPTCAGTRVQCRYEPSLQPAADPEDPLAQISSTGRREGFVLYTVKGSVPALFIGWVKTVLGSPGSPPRLPSSCASAYLLISRSCPVRRKLEVGAQSPL